MLVPLAGLFIGLLVCCHSDMTSAKFTEKRAILRASETIGLSFENSTDLRYVNGRGLSPSRQVSKYGHTSLRWVWPFRGLLTVDFRLQLDKTRKCGVAFWIHRDVEIKSNLMLSLMNGQRTLEIRHISMYFVGWRAIYISFRSLSKRRRRQVTQLRFRAPPLMMSFNDSFYFDIIRLSRSCSGWSYDQFNPPMSSNAGGQLNGIGTAIDLDGHYGKNNVWQQAYRWSEHERKFGATTTDESPLTSQEERKLRDLQWIDRRLEAWFLVPDDLLFSRSDLSFHRFLSLHCRKENDSVLDSSNVLIEKKVQRTASRRRHSSLSLNQSICVENAVKLAAGLENSDGRLPQLFSSRDIFGTVFTGPSNHPVRKFNDIIHSILFPLALDYYITKRVLRKKISRSRPRVQKRMRRPNVLASGRPKMLSKFSDHRYEAILGRQNGSNHERLAMIFRLFDHLHEQGFAEGSACGVMDHFMNLNAMYFHSVYLLRRELQASGRLERAVRAMKWYSEIGEVRQRRRADVVGTTADRLRNTQFNRWLLLMVMPSKTIAEKRDRLKLGMQLQEWLGVALMVEEGHGGVIKPDFVGFHHKGPYLSAYVPPALHTASLLHYLTHNTSFALAESSLYNLRRALRVIYLSSSDYSVPVGVSGRFVSYSNNALINLIPAFAYASVGSKDGLQDFHVETGLIFLRLFKPKDTVVQWYLRRGDLSGSSSQHHNTLGSLALLVRIRRVLLQSNYYSTYHPQGHWVTNYAALSIHRRDAWTASVKGCSAYVWDFEAVRDQNPFGRFLSQGNLVISSGRRALLTHDMFNGWNWKAIPGTTTVDMPMHKLAYKGYARNFAESSFAGGVQLMGYSGVANGMFAMDFVQPAYVDSVLKKKPYHLRFKKSFLFIEDLIICLESDITEKSANEDRVMTTLFQNRLFNDSFIAIDGRKYSSSNLSIDLKDGRPHFLLDSNNNGYYIPRASNLEIKIQKQRVSFRPDGQVVEGGEVYATAVINHGHSPDHARFDYAVLVNSGLQVIRSFMRAQSNPFDRFYTVLRNDQVAHVTKVVTMDDRIFYSYAVFDARKFVRRKGPLMRVSRPCLVLIEEHKRDALYVAISDPDLHLNPRPTRSPVKSNADSKPRMKSIAGETILRLNYRHIELVKVYSDESKDLGLGVHLLPDHTGSKRLLSVMLAKGLTKEVVLARVKPNPDMIERRYLE